MSRTVNYNCPREVFQTSGEKVIRSLEECLADFTEYSPSYTNQTPVDLRKLFKDAKDVPTIQQRNAVIDLQFVELRKKGALAADLMQTTKNYIVKTWPAPEDHKPRLQAAGLSLYEKAVGGNWPATSQMLDLGLEFIDDNTSAMAAKMPANFPHKLSDAKTDFDKVYNDLLGLEEERPQLADKKNQLENTAFAAIMEVCTDGKDIYKDNETKRALFTWDTVVDLSGGEHQTGFKGSVLTDGTNAPIPKATSKAPTANTPPKQTPPANSILSK